MSDNNNNNNNNNNNCAVHRKLLFWFSALNKLRNYERQLPLGTNSISGIDRRRFIKWPRCLTIQ